MLLLPWLIFFFFLLTNLCKKSVIRHLRSTQLWSVSALPTQELSSLGFSPCIEANLPGRGDLNTVAALNAMYELLQIHRRNMNTLEELEKEHLRKTSLLEHVQMNNSRLKVYSWSCISMHSKSFLQDTDIMYIIDNNRIESYFGNERAVHG